jgi:maltooligosyltrehalose trehalohydrolase
MGYMPSGATTFDTMPTFVDVGGRHFVVFSQNYDQVGNRAFGERLYALVDFEALKLAGTVVLLAPYVPLLFMGEEYGEETPFLYFVNHGDPGIIQAVREGRKSEFSYFAWNEKPPDPQSLDTFLRLHSQTLTGGEHRLGEKIGCFLW